MWHQVYSTELFAAELVHLVKAHPLPAPLFLYAPFEAVHGAASCFIAGKPPDCNRPGSDQLQAPDRFIAQHQPPKNRL